ncbi:MAG TPA: alpha/beta hydrolase [Solirubrobacterales bacterium]|nr:alpha/beta hydrolase [Solirubrobacterales bacterium]
MGSLEVESEKSIYFEDYAGDGRPVVLVHGWGMSCRVFDYNLAALRGAGHRVLAIDHRCCGHSDKDFADTSITAIAGDVVTLVRERGAEDAVLVGWSLGAAVAVAAAEKLGGALDGLVLIGTPSPRYLQAEGWEFGGTQEAIAETKEALRTTRADFLRGLTAGVFKEDPGPAVIEWMWSIFMETSAAADATLVDLGDLDHRELMPQLTVPTLLCVGAADVVVDPRTSHAAGELLPNSTVIEFADSGHAPFIEEQEKFETEALAFIGGL